MSDLCELVISVVILQILSLIDRMKLSKRISKLETLLAERSRDEAGE